MRKILLTALALIILAPVPALAEHGEKTGRGTHTESDGARYEGWFENGKRGGRRS